MNREPLAADLAGDGVARGWFRRGGKGQDFLFGLVHSLPWARRFAAWGGFARHGADGVHRSRWTRLYLRLAPGGLSSRPVACQPVRRRCLRRRILIAPLVAPPFRRRAAAMLVGERRRSVRLGATLFTPSSGDAGGGEALEYRSSPIGHSSSPARGSILRACRSVVAKWPDPIGRTIAPKIHSLVARPPARQPVATGAPF